MSSVERTVRILEYLSTVQDRPSHADLSRALGIAPSTLSDNLKVLRRVRWVEVVNDEYTLGPSAFFFARQVTESSDLATLLRPTLERISRRTRETTLLVTEVPREGRVVVSDLVEGQSALRYVGTIGETQPLHYGASGMVLLAYSGRSLDDIPLANERTSGPFGDISSEALERKLQRIRRQGYFEVRPHDEPGQHAIAVPVLDHRGYPLAAIALVGPAARFRGNSKSLAEEMIDAVAELDFSPTE